MFDRRSAELVALHPDDDLYFCGARRGTFMLANRSECICGPGRGYILGSSEESVGNWPAQSWD